MQDGGWGQETMTLLVEDSCLPALESLPTPNALSIAKLSRLLEDFSAPELWLNFLCRNHQHKHHPDLGLFGGL